jgi:hypothetical protein
MEEEASVLPSLFSFLPARPHSTSLPPLTFSPVFLSLPPHQSQNIPLNVWLWSPRVFEMSHTKINTSILPPFSVSGSI